MPARCRPYLLAVASLLASCGGGTAAETGRGRLLEEARETGTLTAARLDEAMTAAGLGQAVPKALCDVKFIELNYETVGTDGEVTNASGALLVPAGNCAGRTFPLVGHAKGTDVEKGRMLAKPTDQRAIELAAVYAAQGYAVAATDYLGFGKSAYTYHPYIHAATEASSIIDGLRAARHAARSLNISMSGKVLLAGFSQGGHASMAAQQAIEKDFPGEFSIAAGAHMSGPYDVERLLRRADAISGYPLFIPYLITGYQRAYGGIYSKPADVFQMPYADYIEKLLPNHTDTQTSLFASGKLPAPAPTWNEARARIMQPAYLSDIANNSANALVVAARKNGLLGWSPKAPVLLCGGTADPVVVYKDSTAVALADFQSRGVSNVEVVDVDADIQRLFAPQGQAPTDPRTPEFAVYYGSYHAGYLEPLCQVQALKFFQQVK